jgi:TRAP-type C4-dicarboxylate transport system substrate-binding protein
MTRTSRNHLACAAALWLAVTLSGRAQSQTPSRGEPLPIRVGTLAPEGTPWHAALQEIGDAWKKASGGRITLTIYAGTRGEEADMIRAMRGGQLQMGAFTTVGLETITKEMSALWIPLLFQTYDELDYVRGKIDPRLEQALGDKGFVVLNWGDAGWVKYFAKKPIPSLKALQQLKLWVWSGSSASEEMYKDAGFKVVPASPIDILLDLQRNKIEAFPAPATLALANQWFGQAKNMMDIKFAPVVGATIIKKDAWEKFDLELRPTLLALARETGARYTPRIRALETEAIDAMVKRGLQIQKLTPQAEQEWQQTVEKFYPKIRGTIVPADLFDEVRRLVLEYRAQKKADSAVPAGPVKKLDPGQRPAPAGR